MGEGADPDWPADAVEVGAVIGPWGIRGWIRIKPHAGDPQALLATRRWFLRPAAGAGAPTALATPSRLTIVQAREHGEAIVAQTGEIADRSAAEALHGARIFISRSQFPSVGPDEYYWVDLIGLVVSNRQGEALGTVSGLLDTGPHSVLRVAPAGMPEGDAALAQERLIPFVSAYVDRVDLEGRRIVVDWGLDY